MGSLSFIEKKEDHLITGKVYLQSELNTEIFACQSQYYKAFLEFSERLNDNEFPCLFGRKAWKAGSIRFLFCEQKNIGSYEDFYTGPSEYTFFVKNVSVENRLFAPLVVFFDILYTQKLKQQHPVAWDALNWVCRRNPVPWPENIPQDPDASDWSFCFDGVPLFINISTVDHKVLRSRNLGHNLVLVINPRENFDFVASVHTKSGRLIRKRIRSRIASYNNGVIPIELGFYGEDNNLEWQQYQLDEDGLDKPSRCPLKP